jgi:large subunit ribosomal protein L23
MKTSFEVLLKPILTEKLTVMEERKVREKKDKNGHAYHEVTLPPCYGFFVDCMANKIQIKKAVEGMYGVTVESVNTMRYAGKTKSRSTKAGIIAGNSHRFKKAMVTVKKGEKIDFYSNI